MLDLKQPGDLEAARQLAVSADVVIENFRSGVLKRLGLDPVGLRAENPRLITCSMPGFASDDPRSELRAYEGILAAATANCIPRAGEEPEGWDWSRPTYSALPLASSIGGYLAATSVVMAAIARRRTGRGQHVEVPLFDAMFTLVAHSGAFVKSRGLGHVSGIHQRGAGAFRCLDGRYVQFDTSSPRHLSWFASAAGVARSWEPELLDLAANREPEVNERLHARLRELFATRTAVEWEALGNKVGSAIGFIRTPQEWIATNHAKQTKAVIKVDDPEIGPMWCAGLPVTLSDYPGTLVAPRQLAGAAGTSVSWERTASRQVPDEGLEPEISSPLEGMSVLDLGVALAGPTCGRMLAEFGAHVVKISAPGSGVGGYLNRGKDSILLDLSSVAGQEIYWRLVDSADVVLENLSPGTSERLGIGYDFVAARRPQAVYTSISCYGRTGDWTEQRGWERQGQAVTGIMERTALPSVLGPYNIVDIGTGIMGTFATALAICDRLTSGRGQMATTSLCQAATYHQALFTFDFPGYELNEPRGYEALGEDALRRYYSTSDGWFFLAARPEDLAVLARVAATQDLTSASDAERAVALEEAFASSKRAEVVRQLVDGGVAAHIMVSVDELMVDPDVLRRGMSVTEEVEGVGICVMPGISQHLSDTPARNDGAPHRPGADAASVLESIGFDDRLDALERAWVLRVHDLPPAW
jgi:crotonobetainyl-CoA:carnitine CoA-transferase CaiB-like acyl-CoA transferase